MSLLAGRDRGGSPTGSSAWSARALARGVPLRSWAGLALGLAVALTGFGAACWEGPDLASGRPWTTSSKAAECRPEQRQCGDQTTAALFMTNEEESPWFQVDLGAPRVVHRVDVRNRLDGAQEAAIPLIFETSLDGVTFESRGTRARGFSSLRFSFSPVTARYVRLRVGRRSRLHLESVSVR